MVCDNKLWSLRAWLQASTCHEAHLVCNMLQLFIAGLLSPPVTFLVVVRDENEIKKCTDAEERKECIQSAS
uniref:Uncharacterized protein n=1 Tax=Oryza rufipogon TaxID=4529 RepID=A0A0E0Q4C5_ORYRU